MLLLFDVDSITMSLITRSLTDQDVKDQFSFNGWIKLSKRLEDASNSLELNFGCDFGNHEYEECCDDLLIPILDN